MPQGHVIEIRYPATAVETVYASGAANDRIRERGDPEFYADPAEYEDHEEWGKRFVCQDCDVEFETREKARAHSRETFPGYEEDTEGE